MDIYKQFSQRIGLVGITNFILGFSGIILLPILTKNIPIEDYGIWGQMLVTIGLIPALVMLGLPYTLVRFLPSAKNKDSVKEIFYSLFFIVCLAGIVASSSIYIFSEIIAIKLFNNNIHVVKIMSFIIFIECLNDFFYNYFRATQSIKKYSIFFSIQTFMYLFLVAFFILTGNGIIGAAIGLLLKGIISFIIMAYSIISEIGIHIPKFTNIKEYLIFGLPLVPEYISTWIVNSSDRYIIGLFLGISSVGYYNPGYALGSIIRIFIAPLSFMLPAATSKHYDGGNFRTVETILSYSLKYFMAIAIPSVFGISILSRPLLNILTTPEIASKGYIVVPFVALSMLALGAYTVVQQIIILEKKTKIIGKMWIISAIFNLGLNILLIPYMGIVGAAITTLFAFTFSFVITLHQSSKLFKIDMNFSFMLKSVFASSAICLIIVGLNPIGLVNILLTIGICIIVYFLILLFLKGFKKQELIFFRNMFNFQSLRIDHKY